MYGAGPKGVNTKGRTTRLFCAHDRSVPTACAATARLRRTGRYVCGELSPTDTLTVIMEVAPWRLSTWSPPPSCKMDWMD